MKTKKIVFAAVISALVLTAAGCGTEDGNTDTDTKPDAKSSAALSETEEPEEPEGPRSTSNTACDVGEFTVFVPEGWEAIPVPDPIDSSKTAANDILLARGAEYIPASDHWTYDSGPYFYVTLADKET
ncbi:MAG: hypothetical protein IJ806_09900, partial [Ruminococcus sp.]|nr:hypothetical protein [Ruminococcus sp.]